MHPTIKSILSLIFILISTSVLAQSKLDSLQNALKNAKSDTAKTHILLNLSWQLKSEDGEKALKYANEALKLAETTNDTKSQATALKTIGVIYLFKGEYDKSEQFHKDALSLFLAINDSKGISGCYNNLGIIHELKGEFVKAIEQYKNSLKIHQKINNEAGIASCYINMGNIYQQKGDYRKSIDYYLEALKISEKNNKKEDAADAYNNIGALNEKLLVYDNALKSYQKALILYIELNNKDKMANALNNIGQVLYKKKMYVKALEYHQQALESRKKYGSKKGIASSNLNIGEIYLKLKKYDKAINHFNESLKLFTEIDAKPGLIDTYNALGNYFKEIKKYDKAIENYRKAIALAKSIDYKPALEENYKHISIVYAQRKNFSKAYEYRLLYEAVKDSLTSEKNNNNIIELQMQYEFEKELKEHELQQEIKQIKTREALKKQKIISASLIAGLVLLIIIAFIIYRALRIKKADNQLLREQKNEINQKNEELKLYQEELISQKEYLQKQKEQIEQNLDKISKQNQKITDSIHYAVRIQKALLPEKNKFDQLFKDYFIFNLPKDIVSGDFYWLKESRNKIYLAVADGTGHGVPGAFMSLIGISFLNEIIKNKNEYTAAEILNELRISLKNVLNGQNDQSKTGDGIDIALCVIDKYEKKIHYAGAYNPLVIIKQEGNEKELIEIKADKMPIGKYYKEKNSFTNHLIDYSEKDQFYLFTDGYTDQFGGVRGKKFLLNNLKNLFLKICTFPMEKQKYELQKNLNNWKEDFDQVDDILIIGFRL